MSKHNRNNNPTFRPNQHLFQKMHQHLNQHGQTSAVRTSTSTSGELLRAIFGGESTANDSLAALDRIANQAARSFRSCALCGKPSPTSATILPPLPPS
jgi:hypothetical protein